MAKFKSPPCSPTAVDAFVDASRAPSPRRGYASDWRDFVAWCELHQEQALPAAPETVGRFLAERASTHKYGSLDRRLSAIVVMHRQNGLRLDRHTPKIAEVMAGIRRPRRYRKKRCRWQNYTSCSKRCRTPRPGCGTRRCCFSASPVRSVALNWPASSAVTSCSRVRGLL